MTERIRFKRGDLTKERVDAIVNAANERLRGGGGVDGAIHRRAGPGLLAECIELYSEGCPTGEARITGGHELHAKYVIHTVGPIWEGGSASEPELLAACHAHAIALAAEHGIKSLAFPAISCGVYGYPPEKAAPVALGAVKEALEQHPSIELVRFVFLDADLRDLFSAAADRLG
ncbi:MAG: O-acetyl-ADP-ribose deacetylase [Planctomycetes bacterium]|nr:O-acetyl-ADP-ribose deacetylase [Planctomycetota bacterium]MCB9904874.1 O-acetyl-ADP-ribose deacetylase [Planctomycetota bacterium]